MAVEGKVILKAENNIKSGLDSAKEELGGFGDRVKSVFSSVTVTAGDIVGAIKGIASEVGQLISLRAEQEKTELTFKSTMEKVGLPKEAVDRLKEYAGAQALRTGADDEAIMSMMSFLATSGRSEEQMKSMIALASDMSVVTGKDLKTQLDELNKTFSGTAGGIGKIIPELKDLTDEQLKSGEGITVLQGAFGGLSDKLASSASVALQNFTNSWDDTRAALGESLMPAVMPMLQGFISFLNETVIPGIQSFAPIVKMVFDEISGFITSLKPIFDPIFAILGNFWTQTLGPNIESAWEIVKNVVGLISAILKGDWATAWDSAKKIVENVTNIIKNTFLNPLTDIAKKIWDGVKTNWNSAWESLKAAVKKPLDDIILFFDPVIKAVNAVIGGIEKALQALGILDKSNYKPGPVSPSGQVGVSTKGYAKGTNSASPGIAVVGEEGPELVMFNGGEQVIPNHLLPKDIGNIRGYADGTTGWVDSVVSNITGSMLSAGENASLLGNLSGALTTSFSSILSSLGPFGNMIAGMNPALALLLPVIKGVTDVLAPSISTVIGPLMESLTGIGTSIGQGLLPIFDALTPVFGILGTMLTTAITPVLQMISPILQVIATVLTVVLNPILKAVAIAFEVLRSPVQFLGDLFSWVGKHIKTFGDNVGIAIWNITHPFNQKGFVNGPGAFTSDAFTGLADRIDAIMNIGNSNMAEGMTDTSTSTSVAGASYTGGNTITINIYQQAPVVGDNGMTAFARMIRQEFLALDYYNA